MVRRQVRLSTLMIIVPLLGGVLGASPCFGWLSSTVFALGIITVTIFKSTLMERVTVLAIAFVLAALFVPVVNCCRLRSLPPAATAD